jgi:hypothetical protein
MTREFSQNLAAKLDGDGAAGANGTGDGAAAGSGASAGTAGAAGTGSTAPAPQAKPINGLRLFFKALWRWFLGLFKRGRD